MTNEEKSIMIENYISKLMNETNLKYPNLINNELKERAINKYKNDDRNIETIYQEINVILNNLIQKHEEYLKFKNVLEFERNKKITEIENVNRTFGEVYKSYVIHILKMYENFVSNTNVNEELQRENFNNMIKDYLSQKSIEMNSYLLQQITNQDRIEIAKSELFLGSETLNFDSVSNLYNTYINDLDVIANDSEGKMFCTVPNKQELFDENGNIKSDIKYNFSYLKEIYDFAKEHNKGIKYHTLLWHNAIPENLKSAIDNEVDPLKKRNMALSFIDDYSKHLSEFINDNNYDLKQLEVLNEIASDKPNGNTLRDSWWKDVIGKNPNTNDEYFIDVLKIVRKNFPNTNLTYNDYNEFIDYKCDNICKIINYVKSIEKRDNISLLNGLGLQAHYRDYISEYGRELKVEDIEKTSLKYMKLNIPIYISEYDFNNVKNRENSELKNAFLKNYVSISSGFNMWGNSDFLSWKYTMKDGKPLNSHLVASDGKPKDEYYSIMSNIKGNKKIDVNTSTIKSNIESKSNQEKFFDNRSKTEIQIAEQIREKNKIISNQKQMQKQEIKQKTLIKTNPNSAINNKGFTDAFILSLIVSFAAGVIFTIVYFIVR